MVAVGLRVGNRSGGPGDDPRVDRPDPSSNHGRVIRADDIVIAPPAHDEPFDPRRFFDPQTPVELEIGCGKGGFLLDRARAHPQIGFVGIEWANKYFKYAADRMARWNLRNVRLMRADARHVVLNSLVDDCLGALHVYHPDPWPKKRHHKRRLFQRDFVEAAVTALHGGGLWRVQTDHEEYFQVIRDLLDQHPLLRQVPFDSDESAAPNTNFEIKYVRDGRTIYRFAVQKHP